MSIRVPAKSGTKVAPCVPASIRTKGVDTARPATESWAQTGRDALGDRRLLFPLTPPLTPPIHSARHHRRLHRRVRSKAPHRPPCVRGRAHHKDFHEKHSNACALTGTDTHARAHTHKHNPPTQTKRYIDDGTHKQTRARTHHLCIHGSTMRPPLSLRAPSSCSLLSRPPPAVPTPTRDQGRSPPWRATTLTAVLHLPPPTIPDHQDNAQLQWLPPPGHFSLGQQHPACPAGNCHPTPSTTLAHPLDPSLRAQRRSILASCFCQSFSHPSNPTCTPETHLLCPHLLRQRFASPCHPRPPPTLPRVLLVDRMPQPFHHIARPPAGQNRTTICASIVSVNRQHPMHEYRHGFTRQTRSTPVRYDKDAPQCGLRVRGRQSRQLLSSALPHSHLPRCRLTSHPEDRL